jgi:hypothetical protein
LLNLNSESAKWLVSSKPLNVIINIYVHEPVKWVIFPQKKKFFSRKFNRFMQK